MVYDRNIKFEDVESSDLYKHIKVGAIYSKKVLEDYSLDCDVEIIYVDEKSELLEDENFIVKEILQANNDLNVEEFLSIEKIKVERI